MLRKLSLVAATICFMCAITIAQTKDDAIKAFNKGVELMKTDTTAAIESFTNCIKLCDQVGDSAKDIRNKAADVMPELYFQKGYKLITQKRVQESIIPLKQAISTAEKYGNTKTPEKAKKLLVRAYISQGGSYFKDNQNDKAISAFDSALLINPDNTVAIFNKSLVYSKMNNSDKFGETIDQYIEKSKTQGDTTSAANGKKVALEYFRAAGSKANAAKKYTDAVSLLNTALKYGNSKEVYYFLADAYNNQKKFDEAATNAQKGLDMETGDAKAKARFYYALAVAQAGKGDTDNACGSFKNAQADPAFAQASKAQMTNLKCK